MTQTIKILCLMMITTFVASCNTMQGIGRDLQGAGTNLENAAS